MGIPGFSAAAALNPQSRDYSGLLSFGRSPRHMVEPKQGPGLITPLPPPQIDPGIPWPGGPDVAPIDPPGDWPYWEPYEPIGPDLPPTQPRIPPDIIIDVARAAAEAGAAIAIGIAIGAGVGLGTEKLITPPMPAPGAVKPTCKTVGPPTLRRMQQSWWGCERSLVKTIESANAVCASLSGQCAGTCPGGAPCVATATITSGPVQTPGLAMCETYFWYTCDCGC